MLTSSSIHSSEHARRVTCRALTPNLLARLAARDVFSQGYDSGTMLLGTAQCVT